MPTNGKQQDVDELNQLVQEHLAMGDYYQGDDNKVSRRFFCLFLLWNPFV